MINIKKTFLILKTYRIIDEIVNPEEIETKSFEPKDSLNLDLWSQDGELDLYIRRKLLEIAKDFIENLDIRDIDIKDVTLTGSMANYNYDSDESDLDLHIIVDFDSIDGSPELVKKYFDSVKKVWNDQHGGITIKNHPVEVYVQSDKEEHKSSGIYSLITGEWIIEPDKEKMKSNVPDLEKAKEIAADYSHKIDILTLRSDHPAKINADAKNLFDEIKEMRKSSLKGKSPEMSQGNIVFKILRRSGYIEKLIDVINVMKDKSLSGEKAKNFFAFNL